LSLYKQTISLPNQTKHTNKPLTCINFSCLSRISLRCRYQTAQQIWLIHKSSIFLCWTSKTTLAILPPLKHTTTKDIQILTIAVTITTIYYFKKCLLRCFNFQVPITLAALCKPIRFQLAKIILFFLFLEKKSHKEWMFQLLNAFLLFFILEQFRWFS